MATADGAIMADCMPGWKLREREHVSLSGHSESLSSERVKLGVSLLTPPPVQTRHDCDERRMASVDLNPAQTTQHPKRLL